MGGSEILSTSLAHGRIGLHKDPSRHFTEQIIQ
jgi:hypothetical protein